MKKILCVFSILLSVLCSSLNGYAQNRTVTGKVTSADDGSALPGVNVLVKGTTNGTTTGVDGGYSLPVSDAATLVFSFIGFTTQEVEVGSRSEINVSMASDVKQLGEVVVTALGIEREERSLGYAVQEVSGESLEKAREVNVVNSLAGRVAGVQITGGSGNMGGSSRILIRGANSIAGNNQPLFVVDGVPFDNSNYTTTNQARGAGGYDYGNMAQDINPDDIESISVLKGPSAAALYGTRASNGVILITTKSGRGKKGIGISVNSGVTFDRVYVLPKYQNEYGGGNGPFTRENGEDVAYMAFDESWGPRLEGQPVRQWYSYYENDPDFGVATPWTAQPNNIRDFFNTGSTYNNNIAISGGSEKANFRLSFTNLQQTGVMPNSKLMRNTVNFSGSTQLTDKLTTSISGNYVYNEATGRPGTGYDGNNVMQQFNQWGQRNLDMSKSRVYKNPDGTQRTWNRKSSTDATPQYTDNPYWTRYENYQNDDRERLFGNITATYQFTDWLRLTGRAMTDLYTDRREERIAVGSQAIPEYVEGIRQVKELNTDLILYFDRKFGNFSVLTYIGGNAMRRSYNRNEGTTQGGLNVPNFYSLNNAKSGVLTDDYFEQKRINSVFGNASFGYKDMIYLDATLRNDWSSTLPKENNSYLYPSVTGSFVFSGLGALQNSNVLSFGKVRAGWAQVGNDTDPYRIALTYVPKENFGANPNFSVPNALNNPNLKPERTSSWEVGTDVRFFNNRLGLDFTYYEKVTRDQIFSVSISPTSGYNSQVINAGEVTNKGMELMLTATPVKLTNGLQWDVTVNWARNRNKVVKLIEGVDTYTLANAPFSVSVVAREGQPYGTILGYGFVYNENGDKLVTATGTYQRTTQLVPLGNVMADWTGGITNALNYKGFNLSVLIDMQRGGDIFSTTNMFGKYSGMFEETVAGNIRELGVIAKGVKADGTPNDIRQTAQAYFQGLYGRDAAHVYDASFVKLREVRLGYALPNTLFGKLPFRNVTLSLVGRNLAILHKNIPHLDPEAAVSAGNVQGIEGAQVPSVRSMGLNLSFGL